jgi:hypothetical protein
MVKHADWKADATGTISSPPRVRPASPEQGTWYWVRFEEPQGDLTDELRGDIERRYASATVNERYLRPLDRVAAPPTA